MVRQPPPPRLPKATSKEEGSAQVAPFKFLLPRRDDQIIGGRRCRRKKPTSDIDSLPDELLMEVLAHIPGQDIYGARLVCRKWYNIIHTRDFMRFYLQHATYGLLFKENQLKDMDNLYVMNPTTGQVVLLPPRVKRVQTGFHAIGYVPASMEYKAVIFWPESAIYEKSWCYILNVGVDKSWRKVEFESTTPLGWHQLMISEGFMHWSHYTANQVLTLNLETETFTETPGPNPVTRTGNVNNIYLSTGRYLSLLRCCGYNSWEIWEMSRPERGEWRKKADFSLEAHKGRFEQLGILHDKFLIPVGLDLGLASTITPPTNTRKEKSPVRSGRPSKPEFPQKRGKLRDHHPRRKDHRRHATAESTGKSATYDPILAPESTANLFRGPEPTSPVENNPPTGSPPKKVAESGPPSPSILESVAGRGGDLV
ncbi:Unknown protein [Striga hermonthica]|uniref:F-box domain-containing protein n=1 Tax=Striga hermonthica TaxID=68872 RepID=A0A9N7RL24_STRHE|nr:Unknown protein [Striga hermonthica]